MFKVENDNGIAGNPSYLTMDLENPLKLIGLTALVKFSFFVGFF